jgi:hypothetical protein
MFEPSYGPGGRPFQWWHVSLHDPTDVDFAAVDHALSQPGFVPLSMDFAEGLGNNPPVDEDGYPSELLDAEISYNTSEYAILDSLLPWSSPLLEWPGGPPYINSPFEKNEFGNCSSATDENDSEICTAAGGTIQVYHGSILQRIRSRGNGSGGQAPSKAPSKSLPAASEADETRGKKKRKANTGSQGIGGDGEGDEGEDEIRGGGGGGGGGAGGAGGAGGGGDKEEDRLLPCIFYLQDGVVYNLLEWSHCGRRYIQISHVTYVTLPFHFIDGALLTVTTQGNICSGFMALRTRSITSVTHRRLVEYANSAGGHRLILIFWYLTNASRERRRP